MCPTRARSRRRLNEGPQVLTAFELHIATEWVGRGRGASASRGDWKCHSGRKPNVLCHWLRAVTADPPISFVFCGVMELAEPILSIFARTFASENTTHGVNSLASPSA